MATRNAIDTLLKEVDDVVTVNIPVEFHGVGAFYQDFDQVSDQEVKQYLDVLHQLKKTA